MSLGKSAAPATVAGRPGRARLSLATKLTVAFAAVAVLPVALVGGVAQRVVEDRYRAEFARSLDGAERDAAREYERAAAEVAATVRRVARADDPVVGQVLLDLGKGGLDEEAQRAAVRRVAEQMRALGLDVYELLDERGGVIAAGHFPGRAGGRDEAAAKRAPGPGRAVRASTLATEQIASAGRAREALVLESVERVETDYAKVVVIGGRELSAAFLGRLRLPSRLLDGSGRVIAVSGGAVSEAVPPRAFEGLHPYPRRAIALGGGQARVEVAVPDEDLALALGGLRALAAIVGAGGLALSLLLGFVLARRIARPLGQLADGARRVAAGDLEATVDVRSTDEVGDLARAFNRMIGELSEARGRLVHAERVAAWREIAQRIAHEIKNPLTPIAMAMETLQRARTARPALFDAIFDESSRTILEEVARLKHIVGEFSTFARMPEPRLAPVDARELCESALSLYAGSGLRIERALGEGPAPRISADREQLTQVLRNLLENARDAVGEREQRDGPLASDTAPVRLELRASGDRVEIAVEDRGLGLSPEAAAKLFTPYFTTKPHGTGLGLAIVHRIVTDHGGEIRVGAAPEGGARFTLSLPSLAAADPATS